MYTIWGGEKRDDLVRYMKKNGIETRIFFHPITRKTYYNQETPSQTDCISSNILSLPIYPDIKKSEINYIIKTINDYFLRNA